VTTPREAPRAASHRPTLAVIPSRSAASQQVSHTSTRPYRALVMAARAICACGQRCDQARSRRVTCGSLTARSGQAVA
jgi:hypothetical protein